MHEDRNFVQVKLPPWLDGPRVRAFAKEKGVTELQARHLIYKKENRDGFPYTSNEGGRQ